MTAVIRFRFGLVPLDEVTPWGERNVLHWFGLANLVSSRAEPTHLHGLGCRTRRRPHHGRPRHGVNRRLSSFEPLATTRGTRWPCSRDAVV
ncbi:DUF5984 family protein [Nocardia vinacea]|uniref:DUF5984 family protein n=1 Tax=Nocardia vinacea TaxID=96468 RepID=UPI001FDF89A5|nr:DUF5984 family protein [Nocardia vinacea]